MGNEFLNLINNPMLRANGVTRYSGLLQSHNETLTQHIHDVTILSYIIGRRLVTLGENVNMESLLEKCIIHDMDETLVGDIPRLTKYSSTECHDALNVVADIAAKGMSNKIDGTDYTYNIWKNAKNDGSLEGFILSITDMLSVAKKVIEEVEFANNKKFLQVAAESVNYIGDLLNRVNELDNIKDSSKKYFVDILASSSSSLSELIDKYHDYINDYDLTDSIQSEILKNRYKDDNV